jgi:hypothetical protein
VAAHPGRAGRGRDRHRQPTPRAAAAADHRTQTTAGTDVGRAAGGRGRRTADRPATVGVGRDPVAVDDRSRAGDGPGRAEAAGHDVVTSSGDTLIGIPSSGIHSMKRTVTPRSRPKIARSRARSGSPDRAELARISKISGGEAYTAASAGELKDVYRDIGSSVGKEKVDREVTARYAGFGLGFAILAALGLISLGARWP